MLEQDKMNSMIIKYTESNQNLDVLLAAVKPAPYVYQLDMHSHKQVFSSLLLLSHSLGIQGYEIFVKKTIQFLCILFL